MASVTAIISKNKTFLPTTVCVILIFLTLVSIVERWTFDPLSPKKVSLVQNINEPTTIVDTITKDKQEFEHLWEKEYQRRIEEVRDVCEREKAAFSAKSRSWPVASNHLRGKPVPCGLSVCPIVVDQEKHLFYCYIPKVASTESTLYLLDISSNSLNSTAVKKAGMHILGYNILNRISVMYYNSTDRNKFFKIIFVRHPFDRLVSAFRSKTIKSSTLLYEKYWNPLMKKLRSKDAPHYMPSFAEFVWLITHSHPSELNAHWAPYWSRCNPCQVNYDFIGKLENAKHDYTYAFKKLGIALTGNEWWESAELTPRSISLNYFSTVSDEDIRKLYEIYKLDFELFGYSADEFIRPNPVQT